MPHKKNPILSERVTGMARLLRGYAATAQENIALWHERDISHSSVERVIWPDAFHAAHYMTNVMKRIVDGLVVNEAQIERNLDRTRGLLFSGRVLLALVESGMSREDAYAVVQDSAMKCWDGIVSGTSGATFRETLEADPRVADFTGGDTSRLDELFDLSYYLRYADEIFSRFEIFKEMGD
jgi:adenylosuccinate lyase